MGAPWLANRTQSRNGTSLPAYHNQITAPLAAFGPGPIFNLLKGTRGGTHVVGGPGTGPVALSPLKARQRGPRRG